MYGQTGQSANQSTRAKKKEPILPPIPCSLLPSKPSSSLLFSPANQPFMQHAKLSWFLLSFFTFIEFMMDLGSKTHKRPVFGRRSLRVGGGGP